MAKTRVTITISGRELEIVDKIVQATGKKRGDVVGDIFHETMAGIIPIFDAETEGQAWKALFRTSLNKISELLDETE